jgi:hypothetical protein
MWENDTQVNGNILECNEVQRRIQEFSSVQLSVGDSYGKLVAEEEFRNLHVKTACD